MRASCPRPCDFHDLHLGDAQIAHRLFHGKLDLQEREQALGLRPQGPPIDPAGDPAGRLAAQEQVLGDAHIGNRHQLLMDHGDAVPHGLHGTPEGDRSARQQDVAGIRDVQPGQELHKRRLPRPILAHQARGPRRRGSPARRRRRRGCHRMICARVALQEQILLSCHFAVHACEYPMPAKRRQFA